MKKIYFMRHSEVLKPININNSDSLQSQNEKWCLTIAGEELAKQKSNILELSDFDVVISSNYVRAILTAKYFTKEEILVDENFGERKFGVTDWNELPADFYKKQYNDFDYKLPNGESLNEVIEREYNSLVGILNTCIDKKVLVVGHATGLSALFSMWCDVASDGSCKFKGKLFFDGKWEFCETFKLIFDDKNDLVDIVNIKENK